MMRDRSSSRSPEEIERDIEETRRRLVGSIEELEQRVSPRRVVDQATDYVRGHGGEMFGNLESSVRANPVPFLLTGIGLTWLIASSRSGSARSSDRGHEHERGEQLSEHLHEGRVREGRERVREGMDAARERAGGIVEGVKDKFAAARERVSGARESASERAGRAREGVQSAIGTTRERAAQASEGFGRMLEEQPLLVGGVALVLGSLLGASLPASRKEDEWMGPARDRALDRVRETGRAVTDEARRGAGASERSTGATERGTVATERSATERRGSQEPIADQPDEAWGPGPAVPPRPIDH